MTGTEISPQLVEELRTLAADAARAAASYIRTRRAELLSSEGASGLHDHATTKSSAVDPVTEVDTASEALLVDMISRARPGDGFLGEEGAAADSATGVTWIIDPIDGTVNFLYGIPDYAVSVGAVMDGEPVAGAVINVVQDRLYHAGLGQGACVEADGIGRRGLTPRTEPDPALALLATGFGYSAELRGRQARLLAGLLPQVRDIRRMGAAALDICRVAEGTVDAYYEHGIKAWDCAAGTVIARESGAVVRHPGMDADGKEGKVFFAAQPAVAPALWDLLSAVGGTAELAV